MSLLTCSKKLKKYLKNKNSHGINKYIGKINTLIGGGCEIIKGDIRVTNRGTMIIGNKEYNTHPFDEKNMIRLDETDIFIRYYDVKVNVSGVADKYMSVFGRGIPTIRYCSHTTNAVTNIIFFFDVGIGFYNFVDEAKKCDPVKIKNMLINFVDNVKKLNETHIHMDLNTDTVRFRQHDDEWEIIFSDLEKIINLENKQTNNRKPRIPHLITPPEYFMETSEFYDAVKKNNTVNFPGMISVIIDVLLQRKSDFFGDFYGDPKLSKKISDLPDAMKNHVSNRMIYVYLFFEYYGEKNIKEKFDKKVQKCKSGHSNNFFGLIKKKFIAMKD